MLPYLRQVDNLTGFSLLYTRNMTRAHASGMPSVHYERFVAGPEGMVARTLERLGLDWDDRVMRAHEDYEEGQIGHGGFKLWRPIHRDSLHSYRELPAEDLDRIYALTGFTGGFNLQIAFSTGYLAGVSAADKILNKQK